MTIETLTNDLSDCYGLPKRKIRGILDTAFRELGAMIAEDGGVRVPHVGSFSIAAHKPRKGRNLQTGDQIAIPARRVVKFRAAPGLRGDINP